MLTLQNLGKNYSGEQTVEAVKNFCLELGDGKSLAIIGRSGSGKSTLLGMIGGISKPSNGHVLIDGVDQ